MRGFLLILGMSAMAFPALAAEPNGAVRPSSADVLFEINGVKVTLHDFEQKFPTALFQARNSFFDAQKKAIDEYFSEYLLEAQAKKENVTVPQLLDRHVNSKIAPDPSEETLRVYYEGIDTTETYEAVRVKIIDALKQRRIQKLKTAYLQSLRSQANIAIRLAPPRAPLSVKDTPVRGASSAPLTLIEYADYECPYCQQIKPMLDKVEAEYKGKITFAFKDFPLPMHANAQKAAEATRCAQSQGKYWEFHDLLFEKKQMDIPSLKGLARELKLDGSAFDKCVDSGEKADAVKAHLAEAQALGLQGTPTFFVNGRLFSGTSYDALRAIIDEELSALAGGAQPTAKR